MGYSMPCSYANSRTAEKQMVMRIRTALVTAALLLSPVSAGVARPPHDREQDEAFRATREGRFVPLRAVEDRIVPQMRGFHYLGVELDARAARYRLKFMRGPQVVWIDVDARTGGVVGRSGF
jgi:hypothetical protein